MVINNADRPRPPRTPPTPHARCRCRTSDILIPDSELYWLYDHRAIVYYRQLYRLYLHFISIRNTIVSKEDIIHIPGNVCVDYNIIDTTEVYEYSERVDSLYGALEIKLPLRI